MKKITKTKNVQRVEKPEKRVVRIVKLPNKGDDGYTPVKDKDYFDGKTPTEEELLALIEPRIPKVQNGYTPIKGVDYFDGKPGEPGKNGKDFPKVKVREMIDESLAEKMPELMKSLEGKGDVTIEELNRGFNIISKGKKYFVGGDVVGPKLRLLVQMGDLDLPNGLVGQAGKFIKVKTNESGFELGTGGGGGGSVETVTGLNTDNTDPANPIVRISVDGVTVTGLGTPGSPLVAVGDGTGDVHGPASSTDNAIARFDSTTGKIIQNSGITIADGATGTLSGTNTGDQTSIVGITGTLSEFNTALTGADFATGGGTVTGASSGTNTGDQTITNSSDATSHTVTLSASGGSVQLIEGTNITLTTGGTASAGTVTIAASGGSGDVTKVGTPVDNQVGVWTGDGTIEGDVDLTFDTSTNTLGVGLIGLDGRVQVLAVKSDASDGLLIEAANGTDVGLLGVGNTANATWNGSHNFEGTQISVGKDATTLGKLKLYGSTSGDVTIQPNAVAGTGIVLTAPATTGTIALTSDIPAAGANTALSNLSGVAINTSLVSDTDNTDDLGTTLKKWANLFVTTIGATATRVTKGWFTDLEVTNAITGSITGNAATVTTNANLTGDVTSTGNATTIANSAVTLAKMANLAQDQFIGRTTASTGVPETATITAAARTVLDDTTVAAMVDTLGGATSTGTGGLVRATSPTLVTPLLGTPTSGVLTNCTGTATGLTSGITNALKSATTTVDVSAATAPSSGQVLTATSSTAATWQTPSSGGDSFANVVLFGNAGDGLTQTVGTGGSLTRNAFETIFNNGNAGQRTSLYADFATTNSFTADWDNSMEFHFTADCIGTSNTCTVVGFWDSGLSLPTGTTATGQHAWFMFVGTTCYASNANGTTQTRTDLSQTVTNGNYYAIKFRVDSGEIDFLVNGTVVNTSTTNLPSGAVTGGTMRAGFSTASDSANQRFTIRNGYVIKVDAD